MNRCCAARAKIQRGHKLSRRADWSHDFHHLSQISIAVSSVEIFNANINIYLNVTCIKSYVDSVLITVSAPKNINLQKHARTGIKGILIPA